MMGLPAIFTGCDYIATSRFPVTLCEEKWRLDESVLERLSGSVAFRPSGGPPESCIHVLAWLVWWRLAAVVWHAVDKNTNKLTTTNISKYK